MATTTQHDAVVQDWPRESREVARWTIERYGEPDDVSTRHLVWYEPGPWKRAIVHREPITHHFPDTHTDILEQVIDYQVPPERFTDLARFDGSVEAGRTRGELRAICHWEDANFLAINLAHLILQGDLSVQEARQRYAQLMIARDMGKESKLLKQFLFDPPTGDTTDHDEKLTTDAMKRHVREQLQGEHREPFDVLQETPAGTSSRTPTTR